MRIKYFLPVVLVVVALAGGSSCTKKLVNDPVADSLYLGSLPFVINNNASFGNFYTALQRTGWLDTLYGTGPYTVLVPNDDAYLDYAQYGPGNLNAYIGGQVRDGLTLSGSVGYDLLKGLVFFRGLPLGANQELTSLTGHTHYVTRYLGPGGDTLTRVDGQPVISLDNPATNGLIQVVTQAVPYPEPFPTVLRQIQNDTSLTYFAAALQRAHLDTLLTGAGPYTVFAPTNSAFQRPYQFAPGVDFGFNTTSLDSILAADPATLANFLKYYILPGRFYLSDFMRQLQATSDTIPLTMLNGEVVKFVMTPTQYQPFTFLSGAPGMGTLEPVFCGAGNLRIGTAPAAIVTEEPASALGSYFKNTGDLTAGNGVVQTIWGFLIP